MAYYAINSYPLRLMLAVDSYLLKYFLADIFGKTIGPTLCWLTTLLVHQPMGLRNENQISITDLLFRGGVRL